MLLLLALVATHPSAALADGKSNLRVLYVGRDPATVSASSFGRLAGADRGRRWTELRKKRTGSFKAFLAEHFSVADVAFSHQYTEAMSSGYDVTIFGDLPAAIRDRVYERDESTGEVTRYEPAVYLSSRFSRAAIVIAEASAKIAEPHAYKMNWYCLCLDAHAHSMRVDHPIFNRPLRVALSIENRPTPANYRGYYSGKDLPEALPMWRVQREGFRDGGFYPPGLVSRGDGFEDADDAEVISCGVCDKSVDAVAIGRHGNFLHWGFSAAPDGMTEQGRRVFVNAVHYISGFDGARPYSRRPYRSNTRQAALDTAYSVGLGDYQAYATGIVAAFESRKAKLLRRIEQGHKPTFVEHRLLSSDPPRPLERDEWLDQQVYSRLPEEVVRRFGDDLRAYLPYYEAHLEQLMPSPSNGKVYVVDADLESLGGSNRDPELLDRCIRLLERGTSTELATRVLHRYTDQSWANADQWRRWYQGVEGRLYFSDLDGFRFRLTPATSPNP